jgi:hypothetical protein
VHWSASGSVESQRGYWRVALLGAAATLCGCRGPQAPLLAETAPTEGTASEAASDSVTRLTSTADPVATSAGDELANSTVTTGGAPEEIESSTVPLPDAGHDPAQRVTGRVIDFWEHPVPNVPVHIGERKAMTDAGGAFTIEGVPNEYDIALAVRIVGDVTEVYAWHYVGLTRRDPTLQIYKGLSQHTTPLALEFTGFDPDLRWRGEVGLGGQHGQRSYPIGEDIETVAGWRGPGEQTSPLRVLLWNRTEEAPNTPAEYLFANASTVALSDAEPSTVRVALPESPAPLPKFEVGFTTTNAPNTSHLATGYVRFDEGPSIQVAQVPRLSDTTDPFLLNVPQLTDASVTLAALSGNGASSTSFVITYATELETPGTVSLTFPTVATLDAPADAAIAVTSSTPFTWDDTAGTYIVVFEDLAVYQTVFVVTADPSASVPDLEHLGIYYPHDGPYRWSVESHGTATSLDELCEAGYLDPFSGDFLYPIGPRAGQGRFWRTQARTFKFD